MLFRAMIALMLVCAAEATQAQPLKPLMVGGDRDAHGCIGSAGYVYSQVRQKCLRLFEEGIRLDPVIKGRNAILSAFVVFKSDEDQRLAEVYLPGFPAPLLLRQVHDNGAGTWRNRQYKLSQWKGMVMLDTARGRPLYQGSLATTGAER